jgi:RimJ/RimL family protein N-acetyltransferase
MIETERLILRRWRLRDRVPFAALNADPAVMAHFPKVLTRAESDALVGRLEDRWAADGIGFAAVERKADGVFVGMVGLARIHFAGAPLDGGVEVGWRLAREHWHQGYATEAARGWIAHGFEDLGLEEIVAFTVPANAASQAVMARLGMRADPARDFEHPALSEGHPLRLHVLYALARTNWAAG